MRAVRYDEFGLPSGASVSADLFLCAGAEKAPLIILLHGFPEGHLAWRHQIGALAEAGFRVIAPDQRGYGGSDKPEGVDAYRIEVLAQASLGAKEKAVIVRVDGERLLLGVATGQVSLLKTLSPDVIDPPAVTSTQVQSFAALLKRSLGK